MLEPGDSQSCGGGGGVAAPTAPLTSQEAQPLPQPQVPALESSLQPRLACVLGLSSFSCKTAIRCLPPTPHNARRDPSTQPSPCPAPRAASDANSPTTFP